MESEKAMLLAEEVEKLREELKENMGRMFAYETTFAAILSMWGKPTSAVEAELRRALQVVSDDVVRQGVDGKTLVGFNAVANPFLQVIGAAAKREN